MSAGEGIPHSELVAAVRREGTALLSAASLGLEPEVPTCPGWTVNDLVRHVGRVYTRAAGIVGSRVMTEPEPPPKLPEDGAVALVEELLDDLVGELASTDPDTPMWNWSAAPQNAGFWVRRMAHESAVHRFDAQRAHEVGQPIDSDLAADGIDEFVDLLLPRLLQRDERQLPDATLVLASIDDGERVLRLHSGGVERVDVAPNDAVVVSGTSSTLLLAALGRVPWDSAQISGDASVLDAWSAAVRF